MSVFTVGVELICSDSDGDFSLDDRRSAATTGAEMFSRLLDLHKANGAPLEELRSDRAVGPRGIHWVYEFTN